MNIHLEKNTMSDVMAKIQEAEKKAKESLILATQKAEEILSSAQGEARSAADAIKDAVLTKNTTELVALEKKLGKKASASKKETEKKVLDLRKSAEKKIPNLVKTLVASITK